MAEEAKKPRRTRKPRTTKPKTEPKVAETMAVAVAEVETRNITRIQDASDFELNDAAAGVFPYWGTKTATVEPPAGEWFANGSYVMRCNPVDSNGTDWTAEMQAVETSGTVWHSTDGSTWTQSTNAFDWNNLPTWFQFNLDPFNVNSHTGGIYIAFSDPTNPPKTPLAEGDHLRWDNTNQAFMPVQLETGGGITKIQDAEDFYTPFKYVFDVFQPSSNPNEPGEYHFQQPGIANNLAFAKEDANGAVTEAIKNLSVGSTIYLNGVAFTTDAAGGSFSGSGSVGSWYIGITEDLSVVDTSGGLTITLEAPLADGNIIKWSETDAAFKPVQLETGASSWNDLTDKPTEFPPETHSHTASEITDLPDAGISRIQDADDFQLNVDSVGSYTLTERQTASDFDNAEGWNCNYSPALGAHYFIWNKTAAGRNEFFALQVGASVTFTFDGGTPFDATVKTAPQNNGPNTELFTINETWPAEASTASTLVVSSASFAGVTYAPLAEGDHLQWDATEQAFRPVQLTDEVGITKIQDASDFALNQTQPAGSYEFTSFADGTYKVPDEDYEWGIYNGELRLWKTAADGTDLTSVFDTLPGTGSVWWSNDGLSFTEATYTSLVIQNDGAANEYLRLQGVSPLPTPSGSLFVQFTQPGEATDVPLAEGDVLQWDATDEKFKPVQLETGGGGQTSWLISGRRSGGLLG